MQPFFCSIPHAGEEIHKDAEHLKNLENSILFCDVDRYVDRLYLPVCKKLEMVCHVQPWHRYVIDCNRLDHEFDKSTVISSENKEGTYSKGLYWSKTTKGDVLISKPFTELQHQNFLKCYYDFHNQLKKQHEDILKIYKKSFHLDLHSMPSEGTAFHKDLHQKRKDIVISDRHGKTCEPYFVEFVIRAFQDEGFSVAYNDPYVGGGITARYGERAVQNVVQVELNRKLYMNEETKEWLPEKGEALSKKLSVPIEKIFNYCQEKSEKQGV